MGEVRREPCPGCGSRALAADGGAARVKMPSEQAPTKLKGRPRVKVDFETLLKLHRQGLGWRLVARAYIRETGQYISHSTVRRLILAHREGKQQ